MTVIQKTVLLGALAWASTVAAHGTFKNVTCGGKTYTNPLQKPPNGPDNEDNIGFWSDVDGAGDLNPVLQTQYQTSDIICQKNTNPGAKEAPVEAGSVVDIVWYGWGLNHRGPIIDYLANCHGPCNETKKEDLKWFKIQEVGLITVGGNTHNLGFWATDKLAAQSEKITDEPGSPPDKTLANSPVWHVPIPSKLAAGHYVMRHEIIAPFIGGDQTQHYPRCINLEITGGGSDNPDGVIGTELYNFENDTPGLHVRDDGKPILNYTIPGPPLYTGGSGSPVPQTNNQANGTSTPLPSSSATASAAAASSSDASPAASSSGASPAASSSGASPAASSSDSPPVTSSMAYGSAGSSVASAETTCPGPETETVQQVVTVTVSA